MPMTDLIVYLILEVGLIALLAAVFINCAKTEIASALHFSLLTSMACQGLASLLFAYAEVPLSFASINWVLLAAMVIAATIVARRTKSPFIANRHLQSLRSDGLPMWQAMATSYLAATVAGLLFFSIDLLPSSMTGDPARHFQNLVDLSRAGPALPMKPVYCIWAGLLVHLPIRLAQDQLFVVFNIFSLGLVTSSVVLLAIRVLRTTHWRVILLVSLLTSFGYPYFALQYGYYTLLLCAAFVFSSFALLLDYLNAENSLHYALVTLLVCGVILTHSYFAPELLLVLFVFNLWSSHQTQRNVVTQALKHSPYWLLAGGVAILSNTFLQSNDSLQSLGQIVRARGFGTDDFFGNILPFALLSAPYLLTREKPRQSGFLLLCIGCAACFSLIMYALCKNGLAAPYYVNRNQLILLPLLIIAAMGTLQRTALRFPMTVNVAHGILMLMILMPYLIYRNPPLALSNVKFFDLLMDNTGPVYWVNAKTASYSPLQFTARDRDLIKSMPPRCFGNVPANMAVLGTDHQVIWFGIYAHLYPSLFVRQDGFIGGADYFANYQLWKMNAAEKYIAVIKHTNYLTPRFVMSQIKANADRVCEGDSFAIYRKRP